MNGEPSDALSSAPISHYAPELNALERNALSYLRSRTRASGEPPLDDADRSELSRIRRRVVAWGIASGTMSGLILGGLEIYLRLFVTEGGQDGGLLDDPWIWGGFYAVVGLLTVVEIMFLYWVALNAVSRLREVIGIAIRRREASELVETGLTRSALEMPNPHAQIYGVDPYSMVPRWKLILWNLLYRTKVGVTSFLLRIVMRRVLARAVLRGYVPLIAAPLYAAWNAYILWRMMNEALVRALGPFAVRQAMHILAGREREEEVLLASLHAAGEMIRRSGDAHPNYVLLLSQLVEMSGREAVEADADWTRHRDEIARLDAETRRGFCEFMTIVAVLAGRTNRSQVALLGEIHETAGIPFDPERVGAFRRRMLEGRPFRDEA